MNTLFGRLFRYLGASLLHQVCTGKIPKQIPGTRNLYEQLVWGEPEQTKQCVKYLDGS